MAGVQPKRPLSSLVMPDLGHLHRGLSVNRALGLTLTGHGPWSKPAAPFATSYVRFTEHALLQYDRARDGILAFVTTRQFGSLFRGVADLETCVVAAHRALRCADRLRRLGLKQEDGTPLMPRPKSMAILQSGPRKLLRLLRDGIEHLDSDILNAPRENEDAIALFPSSTGVEFGGNTLKYVDLADWLGQMHRLAEMINGYREATGGVVHGGT